jgi:hypothetical protein
MRTLIVHHQSSPRKNCVRRTHTAEMFATYKQNPNSADSAELIPDSAPADCFGSGQVPVHTARVSVLSVRARIDCTVIVFATTINHTCCFLSPTVPSVYRSRTRLAVSWCTLTSAERVCECGVFGGIAEKAERFGKYKDHKLTATAELTRNSSASD